MSGNSSNTEQVKDLARSVLPQATEMESSEDSEAALRNLDSSTGVPGLGALHGVTHLTIFLDLFCNIAQRRYTHGRQERRVAKQIEESPKFFEFCRVADYVVRLFAVTLLMMFLCWIVTGTLGRVFPLPILKQFGIIEG